MRITALKSTQRAPERISLEVDGARFGFLPVERVHALGLHVGVHLEGVLLQTVERAITEEKAFERAKRMLAARPRAVNDLMRRLRAKGLDPSACAAAVGRLEDAGVLDDESFSAHYARTRLARGFGRSRILSDLLKQGVDGRLAERSIDSVILDENVDSAAEVERLTTRRLARVSGLSRDRAYLRLISFLARRGHTGFEAREIVRRIVDENIPE